MLSLNVMTDPFQLHLPRSTTVPIVASIPHSGLLIPAAIAPTFQPQFQAYLPHQDWHLDKLYDFLPEFGITVLEAIYSRYVVDLNRAAKAPLLGNFWTSVVPEQTAFNVPLYQTLPTAEEVADRVKQYYHPYHQKLTELLRDRIDQFGRVYLLDLHSFFGPITDPVCLGNVNGQSCSRRFMESVQSKFSAQGYAVVSNKVFNILRVTMDSFL
jgi:N-formylglutamate deformylase